MVSVNIFLWWVGHTFFFFDMLCNFLLRTGHFKDCNGGDSGNQILPFSQGLLLLLGEGCSYNFIYWLFHTLFAKIIFLVICDHWSLHFIFPMGIQLSACYFINHYSGYCKYLNRFQNYKIVASDSAYQLNNSFGGVANSWSSLFCHLYDITSFTYFQSLQQPQTVGCWSSMAKRHP